MNFFEHQHRARRRTWLLVLYFVLAVALIVAAINAVVYFIVVQTTNPAPAWQVWLQQPAPYWTALGTLAVIGLGTLNTMWKLRGGGRAVADLVGARRISPETREPNERRLINVVEEMSIASGTPVPELYVLDDERSINAFVAGYRPTEAVMVVTRGALEIFDRDELQGVVGHEYSHILNGDMRINVRLMGILAGILLIGQAGRVLLRSTWHGRGRKSGQYGLIGLAIFAIGYIGLLFGALIKAAISRQREFLADASSVQFTRNPSGIAEALWKIRQHSEGSWLDNKHADDISHFCFGESIKAGFFSLLATHPPLDDRISAIDAQFLTRMKADAASRKVRARMQAALGAPAAAAGFAAGPAAESLLPKAAEARGASAETLGSEPRLHVTSQQTSASIGTVEQAHLRYAERLHETMPEDLLAALHGAESSTAAVYALVLAAMPPDARQVGADAVRRQAGDSAAAAVSVLLPACVRLPADSRLPLVNIALPALKAASAEARRRFLATLELLVAADRRYTLFEFALVTILREHLKDDAGRDVRPRYFKTEAVLNELRAVLSVLARAGAQSDASAREAFRHVMARFAREPGEPAGAEQCTIETLSRALHKLALLSPLLKQPVIEGCADCVIHDGEIHANEALLMQAIAESLDCPMPPLIARA